MKRLTKEHVLRMHDLLLEETGGLRGLRDEGLLESALNVPFQTFDGTDLYPSLEQKAARLCHSLIANHPFADGNKRIGILAMLVYLELNGVYLEYTDEELIALGMGLADGSTDAQRLLLWIQDHDAD